MDRRLLAALLAGLCVVPARSRAQGVATTAVATPVAGTWELVAFESRDTAGGAVAYPLGPHPRGILIYGSRRLAVQLFDPDRPRFASGDRARGTDAEMRAAFVGSFAYYGRYEVDTARGTITHHVDGASFPNWVGTDLVRRFHVDHEAGGRDTLTLSTPPMPVGGRQLVTTLVWRRASPQ